MATAKATSKWSVPMMDPPKLSSMEWNKVMLLGVVFIVMALLQIIGFSDFKNALNGIGLASPATWGAVLILTELWAAAAFFKLKLSMAFRMASSLFAVLVSGFWFYETIRLVSADFTNLHNSAFFGKFLQQSPGWWTVVEASLFLLWTLWAVDLTKATK